MRPPNPTSLEASPSDGRRHVDAPAAEPKFTAQMFQSLANDDVGPEEKRARIDAASAAMGLPTIDEVNRLEREEADRKRRLPARRSNQD